MDMRSPASQHSLRFLPSCFGVGSLALAAMLLVPCSGSLRAQSPGASCTMQKGTYVCDWQAFRARFATVHTVAIEAQPMERVTQARLRQLVEALGKSVAAPEQAADVVFRVVPAKPVGVEIGPSDQPLATLQVLAPGPAGSTATLLWAETFVGQADRPFPMVVNAVADQFQARFHAHHR